MSSAKKGEEQERRAAAAVRFRDNAVKAPIMFKLKLIDLSSGVSFIFGALMAAAAAGTNVLRRLYHTYHARYIPSE